MLGVWGAHVLAGGGALLDIPQVQPPQLLVAALAKATLEQRAHWLPRLPLNHTTHARISTKQVREQVRSGKPAEKKKPFKFWGRTGGARVSIGWR